MVHSVYKVMMSICCVSLPSQKTHYLFDLRHLVKECIANIEILFDNFQHLPFWWALAFWLFGWIFCPYKPVYYSGGVSGGGFVAMAVGLSVRWQVTGDARHATPYTWHRHFILFILFFCFPFSFGIGATNRTRLEIQLIFFLLFTELAHWADLV